MAKTTELTQHLECYVDTARPPKEQAASLNFVFSLVKSDKLTIENLVKEMRMFLTITDNVMRARGILLLAEVLKGLASKRLDNATIHSLIGFFTDRLADWRALRGALIGCLALLKRQVNAGMVSASDAKVVAQSFRQNISVQSLAQQDRKLCFELLECLLERYPDEIASLGDDLFYAISEAIDGEKDPHCLILTFHIVEVLVQIFPDPSGPLTSFCGDLFEFLGCYFPIHFTHLKDEDTDVKRDNLSKALMSAFSSTPLFEPFVIPLLLEKLSSSLPLAKVDSLKYLNYSASRYGAERMAKHAEAIWVSIKLAISSSLEEPAKSFTSESIYGLGFQENEIATEAVLLLQTLSMQNDALFLSLIVRDEDINFAFKSVASFENYNNISSQGRQCLHTVGRILYIIMKTSMTSCSSLFKSFFPCLLNTLEIPVGNSSEDFTLNKSSFSSKGFNFGALYLCVEFIAACRDLILRTKELSEKPVTAIDTCCYMLQSFAPSLIMAFSCTLAKNSDEVVHDADIYFKVKGLQILATFPGDILQIPKLIFENILTTLMSIILVDFDKPLLWKLALKALVQIGSYMDMFHESEKALSYIAIVVEKTVSLVSQDGFNMPFPLKLEAVSEIGASTQNHMLKIVQGLEEAIVANLSDVEVHENSKSAEKTIQLLKCYSNKIISWIDETGGLEEVLYRFVNDIWNCAESCKDASILFQEEGLLDATMMAMKLAVGSCSEESQIIIVQKAYGVLSSSISIPFKEFMNDNSSVKLEELNLSEQIDEFSHRDKWVLSLFASVIIAIRPTTHIANLKGVLHLFMTALVKGCVPAAQALGSVINKMGTPCNGTSLSNDCTFEEAMEIIFRSKLWNFNGNGVSGRLGTTNGSKVGLTEICLGFSSNKLLQVHAINGLAWIGKALILMGHEQVKDVTKIILECLLSDGREGALESKQGFLGTEQTSVMRSAADAFDIIMRDSEVCLNRKFHAKIRPLYKQRFFSTVMPIFQSLKSDSSLSRSMLLRASAHLISNVPLIVILSEANKLMKVLLDGLSMLSEDILDKDKLYSLLLVLSGILTDKIGEEAVLDNAHIVINCLTRLIPYPHMMLVRKTAIQCLLAMSELPCTRIFPMKKQVLQAISKAVDDPKRAVRQEAVRCRHAWASIA